MKSFLLLLDGPTGAGKTTSSEIVHTKFPGTALIGMDRIKWSVSSFKRDDRNNEKINVIVLEMARAFLGQGYNVIVEQGFREGWAQQYQQLGRELTVKTITVQLQVPRAVLLQRIAKRNRQPHPSDKPRVPQSRVLRNIRKQLNKPAIESVKIDSSSWGPDKVADEIVTLIRSRKRF